MFFWTILYLANKFIHSFILST